MFTCGCVCLLSQIRHLNGREPRRNLCDYVTRSDGDIVQCCFPVLACSDRHYLSKNCVRFEGDCFLGSLAVLSGRISPTFQRFLLSPPSGR